MREVRIRPGVGAPPADCGAPYPPGVVGLSQVVCGAGGGWRVLGAHEADTGQRVRWGGEGEGAVEGAGPDGVAERSGGPPAAAGTAEDGGGCVGWGTRTGWPGGAGVCHWRVPKVGRATVKLVPAPLGGLIARPG